MTLHRAIAVLLPLIALPVMAVAADGRAPAPDPQLVLTRTVHPRIAYRGLDAQQNPVRASATTFPARVFGMVMDQAVPTQLVEDGQLGEQATGGLVGGRALMPLPVGGDAPGLFGRAAGGAGAAPLGPGASIGGAVSGATGGIADMVGGVIGQALGTGGGK